MFLYMVLTQGMKLQSND